ncbi:hypothetical protein V1477_017123 [Vespula maculifrons]|uniref:Uncharacterized protein n=1 Tax=Vespula maculifrons TaxID=7453 RepID=A0ABD2B551_VESMC
MRELFWIHFDDVLTIYLTVLHVKSTLNRTKGFRKEEFSKGAKKLPNEYRKTFVYWSTIDNTNVKMYKIEFFKQIYKSSIIYPKKIQKRINERIAHIELTFYSSLKNRTYHRDSREQVDTRDQVKKQKKIKNSTKLNQKKKEVEKGVICRHREKSSPLFIYLVKSKRVEVDLVRFLTTVVQFRHRLNVREMDEKLSEKRDLENLSRVNNIKAFIFVTGKQTLPLIRF